MFCSSVGGGRASGARVAVSMRTVEPSRRVPAEVMLFPSPWRNCEVGCGVGIGDTVGETSYSMSLSDDRLLEEDGASEMT